MHLWNFSVAEVNGWAPEISGRLRSGVETLLALTLLAAQHRASLHDDRTQAQIEREPCRESFRVEAVQASHDIGQDARDRPPGGACQYVGCVAARKRAATNQGRM